MKSEIYHISLGTASIICYLLFVVMQCILSKKITLTYLLEMPLSLAFLCVKTDLALTPTDDIVKTISEVCKLPFPQ